MKAFNKTESFSLKSDLRDLTHTVSCTTPLTKVKTHLIYSFWTFYAMFSGTASKVCSSFKLVVEFSHFMGTPFFIELL